MKYIRKGNDITVRWSFLRGEDAFQLEDLDVRIFLKNAYGKQELDDFTLSGNTVQWTFYGKDQKNTGKFSLEIVVNEGKPGMITTDICDFVNIVSSTSQLLNDKDAPNVETESVELTSNLEEVAGVGSKPYDDSELREAITDLNERKAERQELTELAERIEENEILIEDLQNTKIDKEADDYYPQLSVGLADNLAGEDVVDSEISFRRSGGGAISDGAARIECIKGNSVVWNQLVTAPYFDTNSAESWIINEGIEANVLDNGELHLKGTGTYALGSSTISPRVPLVSGHAYLYRFDIKKNISETIGVYLGDVWDNPSSGVPIASDTWYHVEKVAIPTTNLERGLWIYPWNNTTLTDCEAWIKDVVVYDLTKMFGAGNEPTTIEEFKARIPVGIAKYAYNEGEVINMNAQSLVSCNVDSTICKEQSLSVVRKHFPDGMRSTGTVHDEIRYNKATQKWEKVEAVGVRAYQDGDVDNTAYLTDGKITCYPLAEPIVTEIEGDFNLDYEVWNSGTEKIVSDVPTAPLKAEIAYGFNAIGKIKELEEKLNNGGGGGVSKDYVDAELTELSAEVSGLSERVDELGEPVFKAIFGTTTYNELIAARNQGKWVICEYQESVFHLSIIKDNAVWFGTVDGSQSKRIWCNNADRWFGIATYELEQVSNKTKTINESSTDTQYPSAKAVYDFVNNTLGTLINGDY